MPAASVIIPCYNSAKYLGEAIESVLTQSWPDFEIIIIDDGSTDNTAYVSQSFCDPRVHYIYQENKGLSAARNTGIRHSSGKYIAFLDADDVFLPHKLEVQLAYLEKHPEVGLVAGGYSRIDTEGRVLYEVKPAPGTVFPEDLLVRSSFPIHAALVRQTWVERVGCFDETLPAAEDWDFFCRLALLGCPMHWMDNTVCAYRFVPRAMSTDPERQTNAQLRVIEKIFASQSFPPSLAKFKAQAMGDTYLKGAARSYTAGFVDKGRENLAQALKWDPGLRNNEYQRVLNLLLFWIVHMQVDSPTQFLNSVFDNLPEKAHDMRALRMATLYWWRRKEFMSAWKNGDWPSFLRLGCVLVFRYPLRLVLGLFRKLTRPLQLVSILGTLCLVV